MIRTTIIFYKLESAFCSLICFHFRTISPNMADSGHSDKSSSEQSNCDEDRGKPRDGSTSPSRRRHKKSKHSKKKSKKKSSKRKRRRDRSRSRSRERHSEKGKKLRDGSSSEKDQADVKTDSRLQTDKLTNEEASLDATANEEVACVASANQNGVEADKPANHEVVQRNFPSTLVIKNKPQSPDTKHETFTNKNWQNKSESSFINKTETIEHDLSLNTNLEEIYDPGLYIAKAKEEHDSERTTKESDSAKDEQSELKAKAGRKKSSSKTRDHKRSKSRDRKRSRSLERRRFVSGYHSNSRFRRSRSPDRRRRSRSKSPGRRRSRSPERRRRSRSRSLGRRRRSRSRSLCRRRRSRSRSLRRRRRSKSRSPGRRRRSRSPGRRRDVHSRSRTPRKTDQSDDAAASVPVNLTIALGLSTNSVTTTTASVKPGRSIADFTALCKKLTEDKEEKNEIKVENEKVSHVYHPFSVKPAKEIVIPPVILPVRQFLMCIL